MQDATSHEKATANRERQARFRERHKDDPQHRAKRNADQRRNYVRKHGFKAGQPKSVAEAKLRKASLLSPDTLRRKQLESDKELRRLHILQHYRRLLFLPDARQRFIGICWFRVIMHMSDPYKTMGDAVPYPMFTKELLISPVPIGWRFNAFDFLKNHHPVIN